jgi:hypothetical protein
MKMEEMGCHVVMGWDEKYPRFPRQPQQFESRVAISIPTSFNITHVHRKQSSFIHPLCRLRSLLSTGICSHVRPTCEKQLRELSESRLDCLQRGESFCALLFETSRNLSSIDSIGSMLILRLDCAANLFGVAFTQGSSKGFR